MPPLWKIKNEPFWFAGTLHALKEEDYPISDILQEAINSAELLILEDKDFLVKGQSLGRYEEGKTIHSELSFEAIDLLVERCKNGALDFKMVQTFRPWKATFVVLASLWRSMGFSSDLGLDKYIFGTFLSSKKQTISLEDSLGVLLLFERLSREDQENFLIKNLESIELVTKHIEGLHEAWKLGSEELIIKLCHEPLKITPYFFQRFILERNVAWLPKITKLIDRNDPSLVAVGTAHLFGESNIIDLLISAGYNIERLT